MCLCTRRAARPRCEEARSRSHAGPHSKGDDGGGGGEQRARGERGGAAGGEDPPLVVAPLVVRLAHDTRIDLALNLSLVGGRAHDIDGGRVGVAALRGPNNRVVDHILTVSVACTRRSSIGISDRCSSAESAPRSARAAHKGVDGVRVEGAPDALAVSEERSALPARIKEPVVLRMLPHVLGSARDASRVLHAEVAADARVGAEARHGRDRDLLARPRGRRGGGDGGEDGEPEEGHRAEAGRARLQSWPLFCVVVAQH
mmetsp:Transcript_26062/g.64360  ORF Transcript_26062/g.64360 Transcript_26062/m.64360 type:complete len:258 (-) Transcript_26062:2-775(-)